MKKILEYMTIGSYVLGILCMFGGTMRSIEIDKWLQGLSIVYRDYSFILALYSQQLYSEEK